MSSLQPSFSAATRAVASSMEGDSKRSPPRPIVTHKDPSFSFSSNFSSNLSSYLSSNSLSHSNNISSSPNFPKISSDTNNISPSPELSSCYQNLFFTSHKGRKPSKQLEIKPSHLRPLVPAKDRLYFWRTPYGDEHFFDLASKLPLPLASAACLAIRSALVPATATTYAAGMKRFTQFCDQWDIPESDRMPASYALLSAFIAFHIGKEAGNTIKTWLSGIHAWHAVNHAPWYGDDKWVHLCRTVANREGTSHEKPPRPPASLHHLRVLRHALDISIPFHAAVWVTALAAFFGCRRLGELTVLNLSSVDPIFNVMRSPSPFIRILPDGICSSDFHIPWTKSTKERGADVVLTARSDDLCPCAALLNHFMVNNKIPADQPLFSYELPHGRYRPLTRQDFLSFVNKIWSDAGLLHIYGHSFRIGGAVELLLAGVPPEIVAATGGWTSLAFLLYWRCIKEILPRSTVRAYRQNEMDRLSRIFNDFRVRAKIPIAFLNSIDNLT